MKRILFTQDEGATVAVICPAPGIEVEFCIKDVPTGAKYIIVDTTTVPSDRIFRNAWEVTPDETWVIK